MRTKLLYIVIATFILFQGCEDKLQTVPPGEYAPDLVFQSKDGVERVLFNAYLNARFNFGYHAAVMESYEYPCDILFQSGGGMNANFLIMSQFQFTPENCPANGGIWSTRYASIRNANLVIENIDAFSADDEVRNELLAEARFIRAMNYVYLYDAYGPVPLRTSSSDEPQLAKASANDIITFVKDELSESAKDLPLPGNESMYGRATKGAAYGFLARFNLNNKDWQGTLDAIEELEKLDYYELWGDYSTLFDVENEPDKNPSNKEMIFVSTSTNLNPYGNKIQACAMPTNFKYTPQVPGYEANSLTTIWASQFRLYDAFVASFDTANDERFDLIYTVYWNGSAFDTLTKTANNARTLKFFDNNPNVASHGNDFPMVRYADILLMKAEAINELDGPTTAAFAPLNEVRNRANLTNLSSTQLATKEAFRNHILKERGWEFYYEGLRRIDLIRHGKFISSAIARGATNAKAHHVFMPIPSEEMEANKNMKQNDGYE